MADIRVSKKDKANYLFSRIIRFFLRTRFQWFICWNSSNKQTMNQILYKNLSHRGEFLNSCNVFNGQVSKFLVWSSAICTFNELHEFHTKVRLKNQNNQTIRKNSVSYRFSMESFEIRAQTNIHILLFRKYYSCISLGSND